MEVICGRWRIGPCWLECCQGRKLFRVGKTYAWAHETCATLGIWVQIRLPVSSRRRSRGLARSRRRKFLPLAHTSPAASVFPPELFVTWCTTNHNSCLAGNVRAQCFDRLAWHGVSSTSTVLTRGSCVPDHSGFILDYTVLYKAILAFSLIINKIGAPPAILAVHRPSVVEINISQKALQSTRDRGIKC